MEKLPPAVSTAWGSFNAAGLGLPALTEACSSRTTTLDADPPLARKATTKRASLAQRPSVRFALDGDDLHSAVAGAAARANASHLTGPGNCSGLALKPMLPVLTASASARGLAAARPAAQPYRASDGGAFCYSGSARNHSGFDGGDNKDDDDALGRDTRHNGSQAPQGRHGACSSSSGPEQVGGGADGGISECEEGGDVENSDLVHTWSGVPYGGGGGGHASRRGHQSHRSRSQSRSRGGSLGGAATSTGSNALASSGASLRLSPAALASGCSMTSSVSRAAQMSGAFTPGSLAASAAASLRRPSSVKLEASQRARAAVGWAFETGSDEEENEEDESEDEEGGQDTEDDDEGNGYQNGAGVSRTAAARGAFAASVATAIPARLAPHTALVAARGSGGSVSSRSGAGRGSVSGPKLHNSPAEVRGGWRGYWRRGWSQFVSALARGRKKSAKRGDSRQQQQQQQQAAVASERPGVPASGLSAMSVSSRSPSILAFRLRAADSRTVNLRRMSKARRNRARPPIFAMGNGAAVQPPSAPALPPAASRFAAGTSGAATVRVQPAPPQPALKVPQPPQHLPGPHPSRMSAPGHAPGLAMPPGGGQRSSSNVEVTAAWVAAGVAPTPPSGLQGAMAPQAGAGGDRQVFHRHSSLSVHRGFKRSSSSVVPEPAAEAPAPSSAGPDTSFGSHYQQHHQEGVVPRVEPALTRARTTPRVKKTLSFNPNVESDRGTTEALRGTTSEGKRPTPTGSAQPAAAPPLHKAQSMGPIGGSAPTPAAKAASNKRVGWLQKLVRVFSSRQDPVPSPKGPAPGTCAAVTAGPFLASTGGAPTAASGDSDGTWGSGSSSGGGGASGEHTVALSDPSICSSNSSNARAVARKLRVLDSRVVHHKRLQQQHEQHHQAPLPPPPQLHRLHASAPQQLQPPQQQRCHHNPVHYNEEAHEGCDEGDDGQYDGADAEARAALRKRLLEHAASLREAPGDAGGSGPFYFLAATVVSQN